MASSIQLLRSTNPQERPFTGNLLEGQPAANLHFSEPGLFFKTTDGSVVKFGPAAITSDGSPPNSTPQGSAGNSVGELWLDKSVDPAVLKVYDGTQWVDAGSGSGGGSGSFLRWIYTAVGGETSLSGTSGGVLLEYTPGLEVVFINGVLITRGVDYSAVNGSSITNLAPLTAGDIVTVISDIPEGSTPVTPITADDVQFTQAGTGAVQRTVESKLQDVVSVLDFIPPDTDTANTDCTAYIQAAIDAASASTTAATVLFPKGRYKLSFINVLTFKSNRVPCCLKVSSTDVSITLEGQGGAELFVDYAERGVSPAKSAIIGIQGTNQDDGANPHPEDWVSNCYVNRLTFSQINCPFVLGDGGEPACNAVYIRFAKNCAVTNCTLKGKFGEGIQVKTFSYGIKISENYATNSVSAAAYNFNGSGIWQSCIINNIAQGCFDGIEGSGFNNIYSNNALSDCKNGILASGVSILRQQDHNIYSNNVIKGSLTFGIIITGSARCCVFSDNSIIDTGYSGIYCVPQAQADPSVWTYISEDCVISNNTIFNSNTAGLSPVGNLSAHAMTLALKNSTISDNIIDGNNNAGVGIYILPGAGSYRSENNTISGLDNIVNVTYVPYLWEEERNNLNQDNRSFNSPVLVEPSPNLIRRSRTQTGWIKGGANPPTVTATGITDLFGGTGLVEFTFPDTGSYVKFVSSTALTNGVKYAFSLFVKSVGATSNGVRFLGLDATGTRFDLRFPSVADNGSFYTIPITGTGNVLDVFVYSNSGSNSKLYLDMASLTLWEARGPHLLTGDTAGKVVKSGAVAQTASLSAIEAQGTGLNINVVDPIFASSTIKLGGSSGIDFSGLQANAPGVTSEILDSYEEGTFTPVIEGTTIAGTGTYTFNHGQYTRVGRVVTFCIDLFWTAHTGTGNMIITGLPFLSQNLSNRTYTASVLADNITTGGSSVKATGHVTPNTSTFTMLAETLNGGLGALAIDTAGSLTITGFYLAS